MKLIILMIAMTVGLSVQAKRPGPQSVAPVSRKGLKFEAVHWSTDNQKMKHNGGYVRVTNTRDGLSICTKEVYQVSYDKNLEQDVQDNFITSLKIEDQSLIVTSEKLPPIKVPLANFCD